MHIASFIVYTIRDRNGDKCVKGEGINIALVYDNYMCIISMLKIC